MGIGPPPTLIEFGNMRFLISGMPEEYSLHPYIQELLRYNTRRLLRVCEGNYNATEFTKVGIKVENLVFTDGTFPDDTIIDEWLSIVKNHFAEHPKGALATHCASGLGRAPTLVAIALMELGMKPQEAVDHIREKRRGCFNAIQLEQLSKYKAGGRLCPDKNGLFPKMLCCRGKSSDQIDKARVISQFEYPYP